MSKVRVNGFQTPFHPLQMLSWVIFAWDTGLTYSFLLVCHPPESAYLLGVLTGAAQIAVVSQCFGRALLL